MAWITAVIAATADEAEIISDALMQLGALSVSIEDAQALTPEEKPIFGEPGDPPPGVWQNNQVSAMFDETEDLDQVLSQLTQLTGIKDFHIATKVLQDEDWVRKTQAQFNPIAINDRIAIVPTWHEVTDADKINIILDPGLAFGTGSHPTTHLCLDWLSQNVKSGQAVLDYGCGSGILAIAAKKLGAKHVVGADIDQQAVEASEFNAVQNNVKIPFYDAQSYQQQSFDIVVANILSSALSVLAPVLAANCKKGGKIALSGILAEQTAQLVEIYSEWFDMSPSQTLDAWVLLIGTKR